MLWAEPCPGPLLAQRIRRSGSPLIELVLVSDVRARSYHGCSAASPKAALLTRNPYHRAAVLVLTADPKTLHQAHYDLRAAIPDFIISIFKAWITLKRKTSIFRISTIDESWTNAWSSIAKAR